MRDTLAHHHQWESESMERKKYALSKQGSTSPDLRILSLRPIDKSKVMPQLMPGPTPEPMPEPMPSKKKVVTLNKYWARDEARCQEADERAHLESKHLEKECQETALKKVALAREEEENHLRMECSRAEQQLQEQMQVTIPEHDENNEELDYYDDVVQDKTMTAPSSQELTEMFNQESVPTPSQDSLMASQDMASMPS